MPCETDLDVRQGRQGVRVVAGYGRFEVRGHERRDAEPGLGRMIDWPGPRVVLLAFSLTSASGGSCAVVGMSACRDDVRTATV